MLCLFSEDSLKKSNSITNIFLFFVLEKAFDRVLREVICFALRQKGVLEYLTESLCSSVVNKMDVLTEDVKDGSLMQLLYTYSYALSGEYLDEAMGKYKKLKRVAEGKGIRTNFEKTKGMQLFYKKKAFVSMVDCYGVCGERIGLNSLRCKKCQKWVHRHCLHVPSSSVYFHARMSLLDSSGS